jgi:hypothetical protein
MCDVPRHIPNTNQSNRIVNINTPNVYTFDFNVV